MTFGFRAFGWNAIEAVGSEAASWLSGIVTSDVPGPADGAARWGLLLSKQGKIQGELLLTRPGEERVTVSVRGGDASEVRAALDHYLVMEDVELGPVLAQAWAIAVSDDAGALASALATTPSCECFSAPLGAGTLLVRSRAGLSELGEALGQLGRELSVVEWDDVRVALGLPDYGVDYDGKDNPHQAALERRAVSWQKGCYLGQEVVFMQDARGKVKRRLVRLVGSPGAAFAVGDAVQGVTGEDVGRITSVGSGRALARIDSPHFEPGGTLVCAGAPVVVEALDAGRFGRVGPTDRLRQ